MDMFDLMDDQALELERQKEYTKSEIDSDSCVQMDLYGQYGLGLHYCTGCRRKSELQVMKSNAGWYLGVIDSEGPLCRASAYYPTRKYAAAILTASRYCLRAYSEI